MAGVAVAPELLQGLSLDLAVGYQCTQSLRAFTKAAWKVVEPQTEFIQGWVTDGMCEHLEACGKRWIKKLLINVPRGYSKSRLTNVMFPAWQWVREPYSTWMFSSYAEELCLRDSKHRRTLMVSDWYQRLFDVSPYHNNRFKFDADADSFRTNTKAGSMRCMGTSGQASGHRANFLLVDDPINLTEAGSKIIRDSVIEWWDYTFSNCLNDVMRDVRIIIMQRSHEEDLSGHVLAKELGWTHFCVPTEFDPARRCVTVLKYKSGTNEPEKTWSDPRTVENELLFPARFPAEYIASEHIKLDAYNFSAQHQQRPSPADGGVFKKEWFRYYTDEGDHYLLHDVANNQKISVMKDRIKSRFGTADLAISLKETADYTAIGAWAQTYKHDLLLLDLFHGRVEQTEMETVLKTMVKRHRLNVMWIEKKQNGAAAIQDLINNGYPADREGLSADKDKLTRSGMATTKMRNGKIWFPLNAPWLAAVEYELQGFPTGTYDDICDCVSYAALADGEFHINLDSLGKVSGAA